jgi:hypothetical protein
VILGLRSQSINKTAKVPVVARKGKVLAVKWGMNPNSSSLGVDVTFLIFGAALVSMATPLIGSLLRLRARPNEVSDHTADAAPASAAATSND